MVLTNQNFIDNEENSYPYLAVNLAVAHRLSPDEKDLEVMVNATFTPFRKDEEGKIIFLHSEAWTELHADIADGSDPIAMMTFGKIEQSIREHINAKNL